MADDSLSGLMDSIRTRFQAELDARLGQVTDQHETALARARDEAVADAERRWSAVLDSQIVASRQALEAAVATARDEATRQAAITPVPPEPGTLLDAFQMIDGARSISDA